MLTHFSLCTGIGGIDLAAEWAGFTTTGQCEIDDYASRVLEKNFKGVPNFHDIRTITASGLRENGIEPNDVTVLSAGFPCQPYSLAGKGRGDGDSRDLWGEVARCIGELKPKWFVGENTPGLFARANQRYFKRILADLTEMGYRVSWGIWGACDVGAPHKRERVFLCAREIPNSVRKRGVDGKSEINTAESWEQTFNEAIEICGELSDADSFTTRRLPCGEETTHAKFGKLCQYVSNADGMWQLQPQGCKQNKRGRTCNKGWWEVEPDVGRVVTRCASRVDRLRCLGNMVVPQQIYPLFKAIADYEQGE